MIIKVSESIRISDKFAEIGTRTIDSRNRITIGEIIRTSKRVKLYKNKLGEILIKPLIEIPASEMWLFKNNEALKNVENGLKDMSERKISKVEPESK